MASDHAKQQLNAYLRFFEHLREVYVGEIQSLFSDVRESRMGDEMYSKAELEDIFAELVAATMACMRRDLERTTNMGALAVEQLLLASEAPPCENGARSTATLDMSLTEDEAALARMQQLNQRFREASERQMRSGHVIKAETLREEHERLEAEAARLTEEASALRTRCSTLEGANASAERDARMAQARIAALTTQLAAVQRGAGASAAAEESHVAELASLRSSVESLKAASEAAHTMALTAKKEREAAVNTSKPFRLMKTMLGKKNALITQLRERLKQFEPAADEEEEVVEETKGAT